MAEAQNTQPNTQADAGSVQFTNFNPENKKDNIKNLLLFKDIRVEVKATLGRIHIPLKQYLKLVRGSIIDLGKTDNLNIYLSCNDKGVAKGDIFVLEKKIGVEIKGFTK
jgi:flagellar motor switch protein FliN/FliY